MKPAPFDYVRADSLNHAVSELAERGEEAAILAGGQSLIALMNLRLATPQVLIDIGRVVELDAIDLASDPARLRIGATVRAARCERDPHVNASLPVLQVALAHVGHPQIRSRTTIGGNIAHADPASELPAVLLGLGGSVELTCTAGVRTVAAADFFQGTWTTARRPDELLTSIDFPIEAGLQAGFVEVGRRPGDFALAGAFVGVRTEGDAGEQITECRISLCGIADRPLRLAGVEDQLTGRSVSEVLAAVADAVRSTVDPNDGADCSAAYRRYLAGTVAERALRVALTGSESPTMEVAS